MLVIQVSTRGGVEFLLHDQSCKKLRFLGLCPLQSKLFDECQENMYGCELFYIVVYNVKCKGILR